VRRLGGAEYHPGVTRVVITRRIHPEALEVLDWAALPFRTVGADGPVDAERLRSEVRGAEALICILGDRIDAGVLDAAPGLRIVANVAVGYDNVDLPAATARGVVVTNTPGVLTESTADLTFALLLAVARRVAEGDRLVRAGGLRPWDVLPDGLGLDVHGRTLGIVGMGRIGAAVARRGALGFGMRVLYTARSRKEEVERVLGARPAPLAELLRASDFVTLHVPGSEETRALVSLPQLRAMKRTAFLINTSRGPVVREADLVQALEEGAIRGAGLDVYEDEPRVHPRLLELADRTVLLPHIGSATEETRKRMSILAAENVVAALAGKLPPNAVNPEALQRRGQI